jgi:hypothetical protein
MSTRSLLPIAVVVAAAVTAGPAPAQSPTDNPAPGVQPGLCTDVVSPSSSFTRGAARSAGRHRLLRGVASDTGCGVDRVAVSVQRKRGRTCQTLFGKGRLLRKMSCGRRHWLLARGTTNWSFRLSKRLPRGKYVVRTRAIDFAGNVQQPRTGRLRLR